MQSQQEPGLLRNSLEIFLDFLNGESGEVSEDFNFLCVILTPLGAEVPLWASSEPEGGKAV